MTTLLLEVPAGASAPLACVSPLPRLGVAVPRLVPGLGFGCGGRALLFHRLGAPGRGCPSSLRISSATHITVTGISPIIATAEGAFIEKR